ncbi:MAG: DUF1475 domain-containing protein [Planctomycetota bacterium]|nr:MAG: DUF1475 domain-containing protein [Planctomycetota bacterium]REK24744.1 MAG: DUF1475 domain-containing protein [Planctomycetota bacterium]REK37817.1 MAG: DUF1475 domain-containing protein [Planctomycetota bacterium]
MSFSRQQGLRIVLMALFAVILGAMTAVTIRASLERSVLANGHLLQDRWFQATLCDAYFGFLAIYVWIAYRESSTPLRIVWFVLVMLLGNIAISVYVLWRLARHSPEQPLYHVLLREWHLPPACPAGVAGESP